MGDVLRRSNVGNYCLEYRLVAGAATVAAGRKTGRIGEEEKKQLRLLPLFSIHEILKNRKADLRG